jgi:hypothetical protein
MTKKYLILPLLLSCAHAYGKETVEFAMSTWDTLDEAFYSWAVVQPNIIDYQIDQGDAEGARKTYERLKKAVSLWMPIKEEVEGLLAKATKDTSQLDYEKLKNLFSRARDVLRSIGALTKSP